MTNADKPAYPVLEQSGDNYQRWNTEPGMTLREAIAKDIMASLMTGVYPQEVTVQFIEAAADVAVQATDALLTELNKSK